jgi:MFS family permease
VINRLLRHPLIHTLLHLRGNARGAVLTEPLWGIPYSLYASYASVYMLALGLRDSQIGLVASINMGLQVFWSLMSGAITDKLGRKRTTFIFDFISWSIPCVIWAMSQNFLYFVVAAVINSTWRVTHTSWTCTLVEDTDPALLVDIYTWIYIAGLLSAFFAPVAGLLIANFSLVPTVRGLYIFAAIMMTAKFLIMNEMVEETRRGKTRLEETRHQSLFSLLGEYRGVFAQVLRTPATLYTIGIMLVMSIFATINNSFWGVFATQKLLIPAEHLAIYPFARSIAQMIFFFVFTPLIRDMNFRNPILIGLCGFILSQVLLITAPVGNYLVLVVSVILEACSAGAVNIQVDRMQVLTMDEAERARVLALVMVIVVGLSSPFGFIAGKMSEVDRVLPFLFNIGLFCVGLVLVWLAERSARTRAVVSGTEKI